MRFEDEIEELLEKYCKNPGNWREEIKESIFSEKQYVYMRLRDEGYTQEAIADMMDLTVNNLKGKSGEIRDKIEKINSSKEVIDKYDL